MSLDVRKLEKVRELANGATQARCPACAESGGDRKGEHLRIYPDGRYGCCVHPKDAQHRKRIFALAGERERRQFTVRVAAAAVPTEPRSVKKALVDPVGIPGTGDLVSDESGQLDFRTLRTGNSESVSTEELFNGDFRTLRTPFSQSRAYAREDSHMCKDWETGVLSVLEVERQGYRF
jgi:hypothetical protein